MSFFGAIREADRFGHLISLNFNQKGNRVHTRTGACVSLLAGVLVVYIILIKALFLASNEGTSVDIRHQSRPIKSPPIPIEITTSLLYLGFHESLKNSLPTFKPIEIENLTQLLSVTLETTSLVDGIRQPNRLVS